MTRQLFFFALLFTGSWFTADAQQIDLPAKFKTGHPRLFADRSQKSIIAAAMQQNPATLAAFNQLKSRIDEPMNKYASDTTWVVSRLQLYWKTRSKNVYIKGGVYDHADEQAPVPTVRYPGARDAVTVFAAPSLEDMLPYADDPRGVYLVNRSKPGQPLEWADPAKTGRVIESINTQIMGLGSTAAQVYWIGGDERYARFAFTLFDTYMTGMYYRETPIDLTHGHHETISGLSTFEVIQESGILTSLTATYDYLYDYLVRHAPQKIPLYTQTFKKWADVQIGHGVAFNNWNLIAARNILNIGMILEDDATYSDKKGTQYYFDQVLNKNSERHWSIVKVLNNGFDPQTGLWNESPSYSMNVLGDFAGFVNYFDRHFDHDIAPAMPVLKKAAAGPAQYLFPNGYMSAFGDSHYSRIQAGAAHSLLANAQKYKKKEDEIHYTKYIKAVNDFTSRISGRTDLTQSPTAGDGRRGSGGSNGLQLTAREDASATLRDNIPAGRIEDYATPTRYSPKVSFFAQSNGFHPKNGLMVAMAGSKGNHMHANGISMEIFGKGIVLGPESGIGTSYFQQDYAEYYSQFPAHNTVAVDGISAYPVMKSNHGFELKSVYPAVGASTGIFPLITYGDLSFIEPETLSDQDRMTSIIRTSDSTGYYVDIFRSARKDKQDKFHDYFYHNLGQELALSDPSSDKPLAMQPTNKLSFSGGHLFAYDYFWDKKSIVTAKDFNALFRLSVPGRDDVFMNLWMKGSPDREIFAVKSPATKAFRNSMVPDSIAALPMPTLVARQSGEAWDRPFAAVFEPYTSKEPKSVSSISSFTPVTGSKNFTGLIVESKNGMRDHIFSAGDPKQLINYQDMQFSGTYGVIRLEKSQPGFIFLGNGTLIAKEGFSISATAPTEAAFTQTDKGGFFMAGKPVTVTVADNYPAGAKLTMQLLLNGKTISVQGLRKTEKNKKIVSFNLPASPYSQWSITTI